MTTVPDWTLLVGDCREQLRTLPERSVQTCVTSPPYFGLRDYGTGEWEGGDPSCAHVAKRAPRDERPRGGLTGGIATVGAQDGGSLARSECPCGARRVDRQIGLEPTPDEFVAALVEVFREVRRVLRDDGTVWLNLGDSYNAGREGGHPGGSKQASLARHDGIARSGANVPGCKPKDLIGIPWMVAFALRADGWYLRSDIIWAKPNPMPESVTDRPTKAHEYVFLLSKGPRYFYDADAVREPWADERQGNPGAYDRTTQAAKGANNDRADLGFLNGGGGWARGAELGGRNRRSVWTVASQPFPGAHFATFPPKLIEPCILAGTPAQACGECGAPWVRVVKRGASTYEQRKALGYDQPQNMVPGGHPGHHNGIHPPGMSHDVTPAPSRTLGWEPSCEHDDGSGTSTVLDPFAGAGTTGVVALEFGRSFVGIELNPEYAALARGRVAGSTAPLFGA